MRRGQPAPDKEIFQLFTTLNQQQCEEQNDLTGIYDGRLRSHAQNFEVSRRRGSLVSFDLFRCQLTSIS